MCLFFCKKSIYFICKIKKISEWCLKFLVRGFGQVPDGARYVDEHTAGAETAEKVREWEHENKDGTYTHLALNCLQNTDVASMRGSARV